MLLHDAVRHAQPEPGALADFLGRVERIENLSLPLFRDPRTIVV